MPTVASAAILTRYSRGLGDNGAQVTRARFGLIVTTVFVVFGTNPTDAVAECVTLGGPRPANRWASAQFVFVADVLKVEDASTAQRFLTRVHFRVIDAFKGVRREERTMDFTSSAESFSF